MNYTYVAKVLQVIDADTIKVSIYLTPRTRSKSRDFGFHIYNEGGRLVLHESIRLAGLNAAEHGTPAGDAATEFVKSLVQPGDLVKISFSKTGGTQEKYGRWIGQILLSDGTNLNEELIKTSHALPWDGTGKRPV